MSAEQLPASAFTGMLSQSSELYQPTLSPTGYRTTPPST